MARAQPSLPRGGEALPLPADAVLEAHRLADLFPMMTADEAQKHRASLAVAGLRVPLVLYEGKILDGRNRYREGRAAGVALFYREFGSAPGDGDDPLDFVLDHNLHRRHLNKAQLAALAARLETLRRRGPPGADAPITRADAVRLVNDAVSERSVASAAIVRDQGAPELRAALDAGAVSVSAAACVAAGLSEAEQRARLAAAENLSREVLKIAAELRAEANARRRAEKIERVIRINAGNRPLEFGGVKFAVVVADPPWRYERPLIGDCDRSIENKYPTMPLADILALPVADHLADECVLFLHIPQPFLLCECPLGCAAPDGMTYPVAIGRAWGDPHWRDAAKRSPRRWLIPRAMMVWEKRSPADVASGSGPLGMGHYVRTDHECVVIMTRGAPAEPEAKPRSVFHVRSRGELDHSEKPAEIYEAIGKMYPRYVEAGLALALFERATARPGFVCWGNEVPQQEAAA